jgi:indole-3-glycerol phosphate synthase
MGRFRDALAAPGLAAIAEFKRRSPSAGDIRPLALVEELVPSYAANGAAAISVLVDERFAGSLDDLRTARAATETPLLAKGFFSTRGHLVAVREAGADAALLILRDLDDEQAARLLHEAAELGLDTLVEAHDIEELDRADALGASVIGVNARDLSTFAIDRGAQLRLVSAGPRDRVVVAESAIHTRAQGAAAELAGADAILVGTALMRASDPAAKLRELLSRPLVKVCGLTRQEDVDAAVEAGADLLGFILVDKSPRRALAVLDVPETALSVAVFVEEQEPAGADLVQLYPDDGGTVRACSTSRGTDTTPDTGERRPPRKDGSSSPAVSGRRTCTTRSRRCTRGRSTRPPRSSSRPVSRITRACARTSRRHTDDDAVRRVRRPLRSRDADPGARRAGAGLA